MYMLVEIVLYVVTAYLAGGLLFLFPFLVKGVSVIDEGARGATIGFRIMIIPGTIIFWPLLTKKWLQAIKMKNHDKAA